jgi:hypothetical protein
MNLSASRVVAGYRLTELIGGGPDANVYFAVPDARGHPPAGAAASPEDLGSEPLASEPLASDTLISDTLISDTGVSGTGVSDTGVSGTGVWGTGVSENVVVKICSVGQGSRDRRDECRALSERPIERMPRLVDVGTSSDGELVLVTSAMPGETMSALRRRADARLHDGAVQPRLAVMVAQLHQAGLAHGSLDDEHVLVSEAGAVSLVGFGQCAFQGASGFDDALARDDAMIAGWGDSGAPARTPPADVAATRPRSDGEWAWESLARRDAPAAAREPSVGESIEPALAALREVGGALAGAVRQGLRHSTADRRRRGLLIGGAATAAALTTACLIMPGAESSPSAAGAVPSGAVRSTAPAPATPPGPAPAAVPNAIPPSSTSSVGADDPVVAATALLAGRKDCLAAHDVSCLDRVDQWQSPALSADVGIAAAADGAADPLADIHDLAASEQLGGAVLLTAVVEAHAGTKKPASLLVVRGEAGWRLRSYDTGQSYEGG